MPVLERQSTTQLSQARAAHQENLKKTNVDQEIVEDNHDTRVDEPNSGWYWHDSSHVEYSDSDEELAGERQGEEEEKELTDTGFSFLS